MSQLVLHLFGSPRVEVNGAPIAVDTRKAIALLAYLAVTGETHQRDTLATLLWPDYDQTSARAALRRTLSTLNRALEGERGNEHLEIARESIGLASGANIWLDVHEFHQNLSALSTHGHGPSEVCPHCLEALEAAIGLYPEPFMAGFSLRDSPTFEEWQFFQEETLRRDLSGALEKLVRGLTTCGRVEEAISYARRWLALDPLLEEAHRQLMLLYTRDDQRNAALRQYRECVRILDEELGVTPLEETTRLYQSILNRDPLPESEGRLRFIEEVPVPVTAAARTAPLPPEPVLSPAEESEPAAPARPLIGRQAELEQLNRSYEAVEADGRFVSLEGEAGIGKTHLAETFLAGLASRKPTSKGLDRARIIQARCYSGETGLVYAPFIEGLSAALSQPGAAGRLRSLSPGTLAEAGRLLPELLNLAPSLPAVTQANESSQARFFEALRQVIHALLAGPVPGVLFLDNLQWADTASLDLLTYLARRLRGAQMLILAAWRSDLGDTTQSLERLAGELARSGQANRLHLRRLGAEEMIELVRAYPGEPEIGAGQVEALGKRLYQESEGLPFVAVEYLAQRAETGPSGPWEMPANVRDLLHSRLSGLDEMSQQLLSTAAVIGRSFDFNTLREVSGRSEAETVDGLDRLLAAGLITEQTRAERVAAEIRYDFTHEKLRALIYEEASLARRRLLHRRIAETIARLPAMRSETGLSAEQPGLVAYHYEQAGLDEQAAEYHRLAGESARRLFANVEALSHFQAALAAGHPDGAGLHEAIGDLHTLRGEYSAALASYHAAAARCMPECLANLEHKLGNVHQRSGEWDLAESHYQASLDAAGDPTGQAPAEIAFQVHIYADRSLVAHARGDMENARWMADRSLELAQASGDPYALAQAYNVLGVLARANGDLERASESLQASLRAAEALDDPLARIAALNNLALVQAENQRLEEAIDLEQRALELCKKRGDRHREAALHNNLADLLHRAGREEDAMDQLKQAVVIFAEIGAPDESAQAQAEIWKLTEW